MLYAVVRKLRTYACSHKRNNLIVEKLKEILCWLHTRKQHCLIPWQVWSAHLYLQCIHRTNKVAFTVQVNLYRVRVQKSSTLWCERIKVIWNFDHKSDCEGFEKATINTLCPNRWTIKEHTTTTAYLLARHLATGANHVAKMDNESLTQTVLETRSQYGCEQVHREPFIEEKH